MTENDIARRDREAQAKERADESFAAWLGNPMTRMGLSMIPAGDNRDALQLVLRAAFDAGCNHGSGATAVSFLELVMKKERPAG